MNPKILPHEQPDPSDQIEKSDIGNLIVRSPNPVVNDDLTHLLVGITEFMIHSDKILTITDPSGTLDKYNDLVKE